MPDLAALVSAALARDDLERALATAITAWQSSRSSTIARLVDQLDARDPTPPYAGKAWITAARQAASARQRGALIRAIANRTASELVEITRFVPRWDDPRVSSQFLALLQSLPFSGKRTRETWRAVFTAVRHQHDPRFLELAATTPTTWNVGPDTKQFLVNRLTEAIDGVAPSPPADPSVLALVAELAPKRQAPQANEQALLAAIYADPDDDAARLVYADFLQDRGDPRGEFITLQIGRGDHSNSARERELWKKHGKQWLGSLGPIVRDVEFRRGFLARATAKFRTQRDVELYGALPEWATVEVLELGGGSIARIDQRQWAYFLGPAMRNVRHAIKPHQRWLLEASEPWRIEHLEVSTVGQELGIDPDGFRAICTSPLLPALRRVSFFGPCDPSWLEGATTLPHELAVRGRVGDAARWLTAVQPTAVQQLTMLSWNDEARFARDRWGAFTRLDIVIDAARRKPPAGERKFIAELAAQVAALSRSLTAITARFSDGTSIDLAEGVTD